MSDIKTRPATAEYRAGWDAAFAQPGWDAGPCEPSSCALHVDGGVVTWGAASAAPPLAWSREIPAGPGWYWNGRLPTMQRAEPLQVLPDCLGQLYCKWGSLGDASDWWAGPIPEPAEPPVKVG